MSANAEKLPPIPRVEVDAFFAKVPEFSLESKKVVQQEKDGEIFALMEKLLKSTNTQSKEGNKR